MHPIRRQVPPNEMFFKKMRNRPNATLRKVRNTKSLLVRFFDALDGDEAPPKMPLCLTAATQAGALGHVKRASSREIDTVTW